MPGFINTNTRCSSFSKIPLPNPRVLVLYAARTDSKSGALNLPGPTVPYLMSTVTVYDTGLFLALNLI